MKPFARNAMALALAGALTAGAASTASARSWKPWAAAGAGFAAGAVVGSALAAPRYYGPGYAYAPDYAASSYVYSPGYVSAPAYESYAYESDAYEPGVTSTVVVPRAYTNYRYDYSGCATRGNYGGKVDYGAC